MKRTRHLIAVALVATALCADRTVSAAPELREQSSVAGRIAARFTSGLRRAVSTVRIYQPRQEMFVRPMAITRITDALPAHVHPTFSPFQFRLPPPTV